MLTVTRAEKKLLREELVKAGCFETKPLLVITRFGFNIIIAFVILCLGFYSDQKYLVAPLVIYFLASPMTMIHESMHYSYFKSRQANFTMSLIGTIIFGLGSKYWEKFHNQTHHHLTNEINADPDLKFLIILAKYAKKIKPIKIGPVGLTLIYSLIYGWNHKIKSILIHKDTFTLKKMNGYHVLDFIGVLIHFLLWIMLPTFFIGIYSSFMYYLIFFSLLGFIAGFSAFITHLDVEFKREEKDHFINQVLNCRDIVLNKRFSRILGGLDYHLVHHLYPSINQFNLPKAKPIIKNFILKKGLTYNEERVSVAITKTIKYIRTLTT